MARRQEIREATLHSVERIRLSLICATLGERGLARLVASLARSGCDVELIIVSPVAARHRVEKSVAAFSTGGARVRVIPSERSSVSSMRNLGVAHATGTLLGFPDDDCWLSPETIERLVDRAQQQRDTGPTVLAASWVEAGMTASDITSLGGFLNAEHHPTSITMFVPRPIFETVGPFRDDLGLGTACGAGEETEWLLRALRKGANIAAVPGATVHHDVRAFKRGRLLALRRRARGYTAAVTLGAGVGAGVRTVHSHFARHKRAGISGVGWAAHLEGSIEGFVIGGIRTTRSCRRGGGGTV